MGIADILFGEAHWLLAYNYFKLAKNQPRQIAGATEQVQEYKRMLWVGVVCNFVMPLLEMFFGFYRVVNETLFLDNFYTAIKSITEGLWIVSGIILIWSVNAIRVSMNSQESSGKAVNVTNLVIHSSAFALFAISVVINLYSYVKMAIVWGNATNQARMDRALSEYFEANTLMWVCSFISQCLLCVIFVQLTTKTDMTSKTTKIPKEQTQEASEQAERNSLNSEI